MKRVALVGSPNSGKTTLFNALTGSRQKTANYPGVTVERKEGQLPEIGSTILDLPGLYSMTPKSPDEAVTAAIVTGQHTHEPRPDLILAVADSTNLQRTLYLVTELREMNVPIILVLTMFDLAEKAGLVIDAKELQKRLGMKVVVTSARKNQGLKELLLCIDQTAIQSTTPKTASSTLPQTTEFIQARYKFIDELVKTSVHRAGPSETATRHIDAVVLHPFLGPVILLALFTSLFQLIFKGAEVPMGLIEDGISALSASLESHLPHGLWRDLLINGVVAGVGAVVIFLPQILILFTFIIIFEDSGYMARAAFILDRLMSRVGLSGRSFIPLLSSFACAIPGIMATRTIESRRDRLITIMISPLMTCSARIPVYTMLVAAFVPAAAVAGFLSVQGLVLFGLYAGGILTALLVASVMGRTILKGEGQSFIIELPTYKLPSIKNLAMGLYDRSKIFLKRAGTVILLVSAILWAAATFPRTSETVSSDPKAQAAYALEHSLMGQAGKLIEPVVAPLGYDWKIGIGLLASFAAREVILSTLGTVYAVGSEESSQDQLVAKLHSEVNPQTGRPVFSLPTVLSLLVFYMLACQCVSTLAVTRRETNSWRWPIAMFVYMTVLAYGSAFITYRVATWLLG